MITTELKKISERNFYKLLINDKIESIRRNDKVNFTTYKVSIEHFLTSNIEVVKGDTFIINDQYIFQMINPAQVVLINLFSEENISLFDLIKNGSDTVKSFLFKLHRNYDKLGARINKNLEKCFSIDSFDYAIWKYMVTRPNFSNTSVVKLLRTSVSHRDMARVLISMKAHVLFKIKGHISKGDNKLLSDFLRSYIRYLSVAKDQHFALDTAYRNFIPFVRYSIVNDDNVKKFYIKLIEITYNNRKETWRTYISEFFSYLRFNLHNSEMLYYGNIVSKMNADMFDFCIKIGLMVERDDMFESNLMDKELYDKLNSKYKNFYYLLIFNDKRNLTATTKYDKLYNDVCKDLFASLKTEEDVNNFILLYPKINPENIDKFIMNRIQRGITTEIHNSFFDFIIDDYQNQNRLDELFINLGTKYRCIFKHPNNISYFIGLLKVLKTTN